MDFRNSASLLFFVAHYDVLLPLLISFLKLLAVFYCFHWYLYGSFSLHVTVMMVRTRHLGVAHINE